jgi:hypothetical protein
LAKDADLVSLVKERDQSAHSAIVIHLAMLGPHICMDFYM